MAATYQPPQWLAPNMAPNNTDKVGNYNYQFDGAADYIDCGDVTALNWGTGNGSISLWLKSDASVSGAADLVINGGYSTGGKAYLLYLDVSEKVGFYIDDNSSPTGPIQSVGRVNDDIWHHVVGVKDGSTILLYLDGALVTSTTGSTGDIDSTDPLIIGAGWNAGTSSVGNFFDGKLSEVCIFDYALTAGNVTTLYGNATDGVGNPMGLDPVPVGYWKGDKGAFQDGDNWQVPNQVSQDYVFNFDGSTDYIDMINSAVAPVVLQDIGDNNSYSISAWIKTTGGASASPGFWQSYATIFELRQELTTNCTVPFSLGVSSNKLTFGRTSDYTTDFDLISSTTNVNDGEWHHVGIVIIDDAYTFYLDGVPDGTGTFASATGDCSVGGTIVSNMQMGVRAKDSGIKDVNWFPGDLSNIALWDSALSDANMLVIYNNGTPEETLSFSPISWWKLDSSATFSTNWTVPDDGSATNTGTSVSMTQANLVPDTVTRGTALYSNYSFDFDGVDDKFDCGNIFDQDGTSAFSVSVWFNTTHSGNNARMLFGKNVVGGNYEGYACYVKSNEIYFNIISDISPSNYLSVKTGTGHNDGNWHSMLITYDGSTNASGVTIYIDGSSVSLTTVVDTLTGSSTTTNPFFIGARGTLGIPSDFFTGNLNNLALYSSELTSGNAITIYNNGRPADLTSLSPAYWWRLGEDASWDGTNWITKDQVGSGDGTSGGNPLLTGDAPQSSGNGLSASMDINSRIGESGFSDANSLSYNMTYDSRTTDVPA